MRRGAPRRSPQLNPNEECEQRCCLGFLIFVFLRSDDPSLRPPVPEQKLVLYNIPIEHGPMIDEEWLTVLKESAITEVIGFRSGLSVKYKVTFESGHQAMCKPLESISIFEREYNTKDFKDCCEGARISRADRLYQGWPEIAGYHLDRVLGMYRKPPIVGRIVPSRTLLIYDESLSTRIRRAMPEFNISVAMHAWMNGLKDNPPSKTSMKLLVHQIHRNEKPRRILREALEVSDTLLFDFLVDDHDRKWDFNWKTTRDKTLLHWDSGLAFVHGPFGSETCLDILCGPDSWKNQAEGNNATFCRRSCVFRKTIIDRLRTSLDGESSLAREWEASMSDDMVYPVFHHGLFWNGGKSGTVFRSRVRFDPKNFYQGLSYRQKLLLDWVDKCVDKYGENEVLWDL